MGVMIDRVGDLIRLSIPAEEGAEVYLMTERTAVMLIALIQKALREG